RRPKFSIQADDGIRDFHVTGVQTCALPISTGAAMADQRSARRTSVPVDVGGVIVGGQHPIVVQSMTNTDTADVEATTRQVAALADRKSVVQGASVAAGGSRGGEGMGMEGAG